MAGGWTRDGAVQEQIDSDINDALEQIRGRLPSGDSLSCCEECATRIPEQRRAAMRGVRLCINCQSNIEQNQPTHSQVNRRGSKDSQLR